MKNYIELASKFRLLCEPLSVKPLGEGFINDTLLIETPEGVPTYILQKKNKQVFPLVPEMMENISRVTAHLKEKVAKAGGNPSREVLNQIPLRDSDKLYFIDEDGEYWTVCEFIEGSVTYSRVDDAVLAFEGGRGIGHFHTLLSDFHSPLTTIIKGFHDLRLRFDQWDEAIARDAAGRCASVAKEIAFIEARRGEIMEFQKMIENGKFPFRVTHNDTKISNILFDEHKKFLAVIDLDTMMTATVFNDFGDAIRSYTNTGAEDDENIENVSCSMDFYKAYTDGFLKECGKMLTPEELEWLPMAGRFITFEQVLRFLMDYINGDTYYKIAYPEHNLVRTRAQAALLESIENNYDKINEIHRQAEKQFC